MESSEHKICSNSMLFAQYYHCYLISFFLLFVCFIVLFGGGGGRDVMDGKRLSERMMVAARISTTIY